MHPNLTWAPFPWRGSYLQHCRGVTVAQVAFDNDLQLIFIFGSGVSYPPQILCGVQVSWLINQEAITWAANDLIVVFGSVG